MQPCVPSRHSNRWISGSMTFLFPPHAPTWPPRFSDLSQTKTYLLLADAVGRMPFQYIPKTILMQGKQLQLQLWTMQMGRKIASDSIRCRRFVYLNNSFACTVFNEILKIKFIVSLESGQQKNRDWWYILLPLAQLINFFRPKIVCMSHFIQDASGSVSS